MSKESSTIAGLSPGQKKALIWSIVFAMGGYVAVSVWGGWREVIAAVGQIGFVGVLIALLLSLANYGIRYLRWQYYLTLLGHRIPAIRSLEIYIAGFALTTTPGKSGETIRSVFLSPLGVPYTKSLAAFFSERLSDLMAVLFIVMIGITSYSRGKPVFYILLGVAFVVLLLLHQHGWLQALKKLAHDRVSGRLRNIVVGIIDIALHSRQLYRWSPLLWALALGFVAWWAEAYAFYLMTTWMNLQLTLTASVFIYAFSMIVGAVSFLPGGLGSAEAVMVALLILNRVPPAEAVALTILIRITTLWFAVALGLGVLLRLRQR